MYPNFSHYRINLNANGPYTMHSITIFDTNNRCIDVKYRWEESEIREIAQQLTKEYHAVNPTPFIVRSAYFYVGYSVRDTRVNGHNEIKEYKTYNAARKLVNRLNHIVGCL